LVSIGLGVAVAVAASPMQAANVTQIITGKGYEMPAGDFAGFAPSRPEIEILTWIPVGDAELRRIKALPGEPTGNDPAEAPGAVGAAPGAVTQECRTNDANGGYPSDIHGAAGPNRLVVVTNTDIGVYAKADCSTLSRVSLKTLYGAAFAIPDTETLFDPRVIFDARAQRFLTTADSLSSISTDQFQYFAVSKNANATSWWLYRIALSEGPDFFCKGTTTTFWDYPSAGKNDHRWFITANDVGGFRGNGAILDIDKAPTLDGNPTTAVCFNNLEVNIPPPIVLDSYTQAYFLSERGFGTGDSIRRYALHTSGAIGGDTLNRDLSDIPIAHWTAPPDAAQPNRQRLSTLDGRFQSATIQVANRLYNVHAINIDGFARWRLYKFSTGGSTLFRFTPAVTARAHNFNPSVATGPSASDAKVFVTFSRTIPSGGAAGKAAMLIGSGPKSSKVGWSFNLIKTSAGEFSNDALGHSCNDTFRGSCRWGDYSSTQIDPTRPDQAWGFNELITTRTLGGAGSQYNWATRASKVK
jgi:hypothetical protein